MSNQYLESLEKRIANLEFWQRIELIMLAALLGDRVIEIILPLLG